MESPVPWQAFINEQQPDNVIDLRLDTLDFNTLLSQSFIAIGLTSMALIETAVCDIPTFSYQIAVPDDGYLFLPYEEYGITRLQHEEDLALLLQGGHAQQQCHRVRHPLNPIEVIAQRVSTLLQ
jgi:hypothetical protein